MFVKMVCLMAKVKLARKCKRLRGESLSMLKLIDFNPLKPAGHYSCHILVQILKGCADEIPIYLRKGRPATAQLAPPANLLVDKQVFHQRGWEKVCIIRFKWHIK